MPVTTWADHNGTVYVLRGDRGPYQRITESGDVDEVYALPLGLELLGRSDVAA